MKNQYSHLHCDTIRNKYHLHFNLGYPLHPVHAALWSNWKQPEDFRRRRDHPVDIFLFAAVWDNTYDDAWCTQAYFLGQVIRGSGQSTFFQ